MRISNFDFKQKFKPANYSKAEQEKITQFLEGGEVFAVGGKVYDVFTGERTLLTEEVFEKDGYEWQTGELYHFKKYGLPLEKNFINYVLNQSR